MSAVIGGLDEAAYIIPQSLLVSGNKVKMYAIFYDYETGCYVSINMASQGRKAPKSKNSWMYLQHPDTNNKRWYKFQYSPLKNVSQSVDPVAYIVRIFLPDKIKRDARKSQKWASWNISSEEQKFIMAHIHRWQYEYEATDYTQKCRAPAPKRYLSCETKHGAARWSCDQDYSKDGKRCTNLDDEDCLPNCQWDNAQRVCKDLPNDKEIRRRSKYKTAGVEKYSADAFREEVKRNISFVDSKAPAPTRVPSLNRAPSLSRAPTIKRNPSIPIFSRVNSAVKSEEPLSVSRVSSVNPISRMPSNSKGEVILSQEVVDDLFDF